MPPPEKITEQEAREIKKEIVKIQSDSSYFALGKQDVKEVDGKKVFSDDIEKIKLDNENYKETSIESAKAIFQLQNLNGTFKSIKLKEYFFPETDINRELIDDTGINKIMPLKILWELDKESFIKDEFYELLEQGNTVKFRTIKIVENSKIEVIKRFTFYDDYLYDFDLMINNLSGNEVKFDKFTAAANSPDEIKGSFGLVWFPGIRNESTKYRVIPEVLYSSSNSVSSLTKAGKSKIKSFLGDNTKSDFILDEIKAGSPDWITVNSAFFSNIIIPGEETKLKGLQGIKSEFSAGFFAIIPDFKLGPLEKAMFKFKIYSGPKKYDVLKNIMKGYHLEYAIDFGWTKIIAIILLKVLNFFYGIIPDYGIAIIFF